MPSEKILIVDDNPDIRNSCSVALKSSGYNVICASSGEMAMNLLKKISPDVVLTDYEMGGMNGLELLKEIKKCKPDCEVIMMTAYPSGELARKVLVDGKGASFIIKPIDIEKLRIAIKNCLGKKIARQHIEDVKRAAEDIKDGEQSF